MPTTAGERIHQNQDSSSSGCTQRKRKKQGSLGPYSERCSRGATEVQQGCNRGATGVQQGYNKGATEVQQRCNRGATEVQ
jgi:hypothetical protein